MRCVGSSPAAAASALRNRLAADPDRLEEQVFDDDGEEADAVDVEPASGVEHADEALVKLVEEAERLVSVSDPKLNALVALLKPLVKSGSQSGGLLPFHRNGDARRGGPAQGLPQAADRCGYRRAPELTNGGRASRRWANSEQRLLVATDCLSEGVNLQELFDSVVHYDLSWNPTRHQQREGRVDRFGQRAPLVRSALLYSPDSAIDGAVLDVILRKAEAIRQATGVTVPLPEERGAVTGALMNAVLLRKKTHSHRQLTFDFGNDVAAMETRWRDAEEGEKRSRARFAQNAIKPEEVAPEWRRWRDLAGLAERSAAFRRARNGQVQLAPGSGERRIQGASRAPAKGARRTACRAGSRRDRSGRLRRAATRRGRSCDAKPPAAFSVGGSPTGEARSTAPAMTSLAERALGRPRRCSS